MADLNFEDMLKKGQKLGEDIKGYGDKALKTAAKVSDSSSNGSIIARARNSVLQFPVYITNSGIRVNEAHLISKFLERVYASYVQQTLAQNPIRSEEDLQNMNFLKDIHVNFKESGYVPNKYYTPIDDIDKMITESKYNKIYGDGFVVEFTNVEITDPYYLAEFRRLSHEPLEGFKFEDKRLGIGGGTYNSADDKDQEEPKKAETPKKTETTKKKDDPDRNKTSSTIEKTKYPDKEYSDNQLIEIATGREVSDDEFRTDPKTMTPKEIREIEKARDERIKENNAALIDLQNKIKRANGYDVTIDGKKVKIYHRKDRNGDDIFFTPGKEKTGTVSITNFNNRDKAVALPEILKDVEIKKINGMLPYAIKCSFRVAGTNHIADIDYLIGVKTVLHLVDMKELAKDLPSIIEGSMKGLRKIKYKMGELSWLDYMFDLKGVKKNAAKKLNSNSRWLSTLKALSDAKNTDAGLTRDLAQLIGKENGIPLPNASLVISKNEVEDMREKTGIDINDTKVANRLMNKLFLICLIIIDGSASSMKVLMEGQTSWDVQALAQLDAEKSKMDNSAIMQELGKMIYNGRR